MICFHDWIYGSFIKDAYGGEYPTERECRKCLRKEIMISRIGWSHFKEVTYKTKDGTKKSLELE